MSLKLKNKIVIAVPKGRILQELLPIFTKVGIKLEDAFFNEECRQLIFKTNYKNLEIIRVRSFDTASFVAFGGADLAISGLDVVREFAYDSIYMPLNLNIGKCRLSVAATESKNLAGLTTAKVATKYPNLTREYFSSFGVQSECIKLNGAMEIAPKLGLADFIVDLVSSGQTMKENNLQELATIVDISSYLIVNKNVMVSKLTDIKQIIRQFEEAIK
jgi:ATP phosphoribosyltransferase